MMRTWIPISALILSGLLIPIIPAHAKAPCAPSSLPTLPGVRITAVTEESAPAPHCKVAGVIGAEINFELRLPDDWNGKFVFGGGGGFVGSVMNAAHDVEDVVADGWATVGTDTGHRGNARGARWALNNLERLVNFGHLAVHRTTVNAKALTEAYYSRPISRSIFFGCSRGGGQALMEAQRYPQDYDGIVAMAPAYDWTYEMGAKWTQVAQAMYPDPANISEPVLNPDALKVLGDAVMARCDGLDGLEDGILNDPRQCHFDVRELACGTAPANACLSPEQVAAAEAIYGDLDIAGRVVRGRPFGGELPGYPFGWDLWLTGGYAPDEEEVEFHEGADSEEFPAPPVANATWGFAIGVMGSFLHNDQDWTYAGYDYSDFAEKAARVASTLNADNPDLSAFRAQGGKLIIDNGWMDASLSPYQTIAYYERVLELDPSARKDVRLFLRPGVTHCRLGPGPDGTDYLAAMDAWLDTGEAPEQLPAVFRDLAGQPTGGGRIVCAHPSVVTYRGEGDPRDPASFRCEAPK